MILKLLHYPLKYFSLGAEKCFTTYKKEFSFNNFIYFVSGILLALFLGCLFLKTLLPTVVYFFLSTFVLGLILLFLCSFLFFIFNELDREDSFLFYEKIILKVHNLLNSSIHKKQLILSYQKGSYLNKLFKYNAIDLEYKKETDDYISFEHPESCLRCISLKDFNKYKRIVRLMKIEGVDVSTNSYELMNNIQLLKEIKKEKAYIVKKEREIRSKIFMNEKSINLFEEEYAKELIKKDDNVFMENKKYNIFEIENE